MNESGCAALIAWPAQAAFGRAVPKSKIYEQRRASKRLKELFVQQVEQIVWQYKLAPETINLPARPGVPEIQVFSVHVKTPQLHHDVLHAIDSAVQFPVFFELVCDGRVQWVACYRRPSEADANLWVLGEYHVSTWVPSDGIRVPMPVALDLGSLYEQLLHQLMPLRVRPGEALTDLSERIALTRAKQRELESATARLEKEIQFNRKVDINATVRELQSELEQLSR